MRPAGAERADRLDVAPDRPRRTTTCRPTTSSPTTRRAPRRRGGDLPRGDGGGPDGAADGAHARRLPAGIVAATSGSARACTRTARSCSCSSSTAAGSRSRRRRARRPSRPRRCRAPRFQAEPRALTIGRDRELVRGLRAVGGAARATGGLDGVEVSMAHGYLIAQFFTRAQPPRRRLRRRPRRAVRFAARCSRAVRAEAARRLAVGVRLSADELTPGGQGRRRCAEIAARCAATGLRRLRLARARPLRVLPRLDAGSSRRRRCPPTRSPPAPRDGAAVGVPLIGTTRVVDLGAAERLVADGARGRGRHDPRADRRPGAAAKAAPARAARSSSASAATRRCIGHYHAGVPIGCVVNPRTGRERTLPRRSGRAAPSRARRRRGARRRGGRGRGGRAAATT